MHVFSLTLHEDTQSKVKSLLTSQKAHQAGTYLRFH